MVYFLYGENSYLIAEKLTQIKKNFAEKHGDTNISQFSAKDLDFNQIVQAVQSMPLLASKKLVIIKNSLSEGNKDLQERLADFLEEVPQDTILVFSESGEFDRRAKLFKRLTKLAKSKEFINLSSGETLNWIKKKVEEGGGQIDFPAQEKLNLYAGPDLWRLKNEIEKLLSFDKEITPESIEGLVSAQITGNVFSMLDGIGEKNLEKAAKMLQSLIDLGESEQYIFSMFAYQVRNMLIIKELAEKGVGQNKIAQKAHLHPFVVQKTLDQIENFNLSKIKKIYDKLTEADYSIKIGQTQPRVALDLLLIGLCQ